MPGSFGHLVRRFFDFTFAKAPGPDERERITGWLSEAESTVFFSQDPRDQAHGYQSALYVREEGFGGDVIRAALLHDVGKREAGLGPIGRSIASLLIKLGLPLSTRMRAYRDHGEIAARELSALGSPVLVIDFARFHHEDRPGDFEAELWAALQRADQPAKTSIRPRRG